VTAFWVLFPTTFKYILASKEIGDVRDMVVVTLSVRTVVHVGHLVSLFNLFDVLSFANDLATD